MGIQATLMAVNKSAIRSILNTRRKAPDLVLNIVLPELENMI